MPTDWKQLESISYNGLQNWNAYEEVEEGERQSYMICERVEHVNGILMLLLLSKGEKNLSCIAE